jgi:hypothetical protein
MLIAVFALLAAACGGGDASDTGTASDDETRTTAVTETTVAETTTTAAAETTTTAAPETTTTAVDPTTTTVAGDTLAFSELDSAFVKTSEIDAARMEGSIVIAGIEGLPSGTEFAMPFSGAFDNATGAFSFTMDLSGIAAAAGEEIPAEFGDLFSEMEIRTIGDVAYMRFPFFSAFLGVETEWIKIPADEAGSAAGGFSGGVSPANPTGSLDAFRDADAKVSELGREEVRGVETTRYLVLIDMEQLLANATPEERAELEAQGPLPFDELPLQLWIGDDDLIYRYVMDISGDSVDAAPGEGFERMTMTFDIYDYGATIEIEEPPAADVTDAEELGGLFDF